MENKIKISTNRSFGIVFFIVFTAIGIWPILSSGEIRVWSLIVGAFFLVLGFFNSKLLTPLNKMWFKFGIFLGNFIAPFVMGLVFFLVVTPTGLIMRILGKDLLNLKKTNKDTYWIDKDNTNNNLKNQF